MISSQTSGPRPARRGARPLLAVLATAALLVGAAPATALTPQEAGEGELIAAVNAARAQAGLAPLAVSPRLTVLAREQSAAMAAGGRLAHSQGLGHRVRDWRALAENVGHGGSPAHVHTLLMQSPSHRANVLSADSRRAGIGVTSDRSGRLWVTQIFVQPR